MIIVNLLVVICLIILIAILYVGTVLRIDLHRIKQTLKEKEMSNICHYINNERISVRTKDCKFIKHRAHVVRIPETDEYKIIIDLE